MHTERKQLLLSLQDVDGLRWKTEPRHCLRRLLRGAKLPDSTWQTNPTRVPRRRLCPRSRAPNEPVQGCNGVGLPSNIITDTRDCHTPELQGTDRCEQQRWRLRVWGREKDRPGVGVGLGVAAKGRRSESPQAESCHNNQCRQEDLPHLFVAFFFWLRPR
jgi:hypothetical protein